MKVTASAPLKLTEAVVAPAPTVVKTSLKVVCAPAVILLVLTYVLFRVAAFAGAIHSTLANAINSAASTSFMLLIFVLSIVAPLFLFFLLNLLYVDSIMVVVMSVKPFVDVFITIYAFCVFLIC